MKFSQYVILSTRIGSRYVCDPPVMDTDRDTLILVPDVSEAERLLLQEGWTTCLEGEYFATAFKAYRKGTDNYVITSDETFFQRYLIAAEVAKALNLRDKEDRIKAHEAAINASGGTFGLIAWD